MNSLKDPERQWKTKPFITYMIIQPSW